MELKLPLAKLEHYGAYVEPAGEGFYVSINHQRHGPFPLPPDPAAFAAVREEDATHPASAAQGAIGALVEYTVTAARINGDERYSPVGRSEQLVAPNKQLVNRLTLANVLIDTNRKGLDNLEAQRYQLPGLPTDQVAAIREQEMRQYLRLIPHNKLEPVFKALEAGEDSNLLRALLNDPIAESLPTEIGKRLRDYAVNGWRRRIDLADPVGQESLSLARASLEWGERSVAIAQAMSLRVLRPAPDFLIETAGKGNAQRYFNVAPADVARWERVQLANKLRSAA